MRAISERNAGAVDIVRDYSASNNIIRKNQVIHDLKLDQKQVESAFYHLVNQGWLKRIEKGLYAFQEQRPNPHDTPVEVKIMRAMLIKMRFSANDISTAVGSPKTYIHKRFRVYRANELMKQDGIRDDQGSPPEKMYRLTFKGKEWAKKEEKKVITFTPNPIKDEVAELNRYICTGMVIANDEVRQTAMRLCMSIFERLKADADMPVGDASEAGVVGATPASAES